MNIPTWSNARPRCWYLVETKRHCELRAQLYLRSKGVNAYLPRTFVWPRPAIGSEVGAMFPGYLFVELDLSIEHSTVMWGLGVRRFVSFADDCPAEVPAEVIECLRDREGDDGLIRCDDDEPAGKVVRLACGPLKDFYGVVKTRLEARERVILLIEFLHQQVKVEAPASWIKRA